MPRRIPAAAAALVLAVSGAVVTAAVLVPGGEDPEESTAAAPEPSVPAPALVQAEQSGLDYTTENAASYAYSLLLATQGAAGAPAPAAPPAQGGAEAGADPEGGVPPFGDAEPREANPAPQQAPPANDVPANDVPPSAGRAGQPADASLNRLQDQAVFAGCLSAVTGYPDVKPLLVDLARFESQPAAVVVVPSEDPATADVWVVGPSCSSSQDNLLYTVRIPRY